MARRPNLAQKTHHKMELTLQIEFWCFQRWPENERNTRTLAFLYFFCQVFSPLRTPRFSPDTPTSHPQVIPKQPLGFLFNLQIAWPALTTTLEGTGQWSLILLLTGWCGVFSYNERQVILPSILSVFPLTSIADSMKTALAGCILR